MPVSLHFGIRSNLAQPEEPSVPERTDVVNELLKLLPELAVTLREAGPHAQARRGRPHLRLTTRQMAAVIHLGRWG
jgi:hypothetical protein